MDLSYTKIAASKRQRDISSREMLVMTALGTLAHCFSIHVVLRTTRLIGKKGKFQYGI